MKISVLTASHNYAQYVGETIESVLAQTFTDWEMIIVDDGSTDNSLEVIQAYAEKDPRIKVFTHPDGKNHGLAATLQLGLEKAQGEWIAFLESDDLFTPTSLEEKLVATVSYPESVLIFTSMTILDETQNTQYAWKTKYSNIPICKPFIPGRLLLKPGLIGSFSAVLVKREHILRCSFETPSSYQLDCFLWAQLSHDFMLYLDLPLTIYRRHSDSFSSGHGYTKIVRDWRYQTQIRQFIAPPRGFWEKISFFCFRLNRAMRIFRESVIRINASRGVFIFGRRWF